MNYPLKHLVTSLAIALLVVAPARGNSSFNAENINVTGISITPEATTVSVGSRVPFTASVSPDGASKFLVWQSSDPNIAEVLTDQGLPADTGWVMLTSDFDKTKRFKKVRVKPENTADGYVYYNFARKPNGQSEDLLYSISTKSLTAYDAGVKKESSAFTSVGNGWYEYEFSDNLYFRSAQQNVGSGYVQVYLDGTYTTNSPTVQVLGEKVGVLTITATTTDGSKLSDTSSITVTPLEEDKDDFIINGVSFKMIPVQGGTFIMGATAEQGSDAEENEKPAHQVTLSSYKISETEVTQALWQAVMGNNPSHFTGDLQRPVEMISWEDCQVFVSRLSKLTGFNFRLPTEAEWEYAARGGNQSINYKYAGSNNISDVAWYKANAMDVGSGNPNYGTHPVAQKAPNELGIYDMSGNVFEWCQDWRDDTYYNNSPLVNPTGPTSGTNHIHRGGSWRQDGTFCRVSDRLSNTPSFSGNNLGLRLACDPIIEKGLIIQPSDLTMIVGCGADLNAVIIPDNLLCQGVEWTSSDIDIVEVDANGKLRAKRSGVAYVMAKATDGSNISDTCRVTVINPNETDTTEFIVNDVSFKMIPVQGGTFTMGATSEQAPDFGTFYCHHIAAIENQSFNSNYLVTQGDASQNLLIFAPCLSGKNVTVRVQLVLLWSINTTESLLS